MDLTAADSLIIVAVLAAAAYLLAVAEVLRIPYPILLVLGGLGLSFVPGAPRIELPPDLVLVAVLPPLLYGSAFFTSLRELRANVRPIGLLAIGLVLMTTLAVAAVAHAMIPGLDWPTAFVLGAIVSPTDPTAATAIAERLGLQRRLVVLIEGESLVNDGTALVAYRVAVAAIVTGSFSLVDATGRFVLNVAGGIAVGLAVGLVLREVRRRIDNPPVEITISIMSGYFAYLPADAAGVSGVLAAVTVGIFMGWHTPQLTTPQMRLQGQAVWEIVFFLLNALLFTLVGLQLPVILDRLSGFSTVTLIRYAVLIAATVVAARFVWVFATMLLPRTLRRRDPAPHLRPKIVLGWAGMRGAVSLAAALALPLTTDAGDSFPNRELIVFLTFAVILGTLVVQGLTLPGLIRLLDLEGEELEAKEDAKARIHAAEAALARLDELIDEDWVREETAERLRGLYGFRRSRFQARFDGEDDGSIEQQSSDYQRLRRELLDAERAAVLVLRREGTISDDVMRRVVRDLDLDDARLDV
ncbi:MAG TPA: Na+/H+ antiporter [Gaiellaceae bacterium]|nr:Na+/H+ antiporter [Gaiellaceae bacterium]